MRVLCILLLLAAAGSTRAEVPELEVEAPPTSPGHPRILLAPRPGRTAALLISFRAGSVEDENTPGLTRVTQHALLEANQRWDYEQLATTAFAAGAELGMETGLHESTFTLLADSQDFPALAERFAAMILSPRIERRRFRDAVQRALQDEREPGKGSDLLAFLASIAITDPRYQNPPFGDQSLDAITCAMVEEHLRGPMAPANATVVVAGSFDRARLLRALSRFAGGSALRVERPHFDLPLNARVGGAQEVHFLAHPFQVRSAEQAAAARVLASLMEERILQRFRGAGVGYSVLSWHFHAEWIDLLMAVLPAHDPSEIDLAPVLRQVAEEVQHGTLAPGLFERNRARTLRELQAIDRDPARLAAELAAGGPSWYGPEPAQALRALSQAKFAELAAGWLAPESAIYVLVTPKAAQRPTRRGSR